MGEARKYIHVCDLGCPFKKQTFISLSGIQWRRGRRGGVRGVGRMGRWERAHTNIYSHQCLKDLFFRIYILYNKSTWVKFLNHLQLLVRYVHMWEEGRDSLEYHNKNIVTISCIIWYYFYIKYTINREILQWIRLLLAFDNFIIMDFNGLWHIVKISRGTQYTEKKSAMHATTSCMLMGLYLRIL